MKNLSDGLNPLTGRNMSCNLIWMSDDFFDCVFCLSVIEHIPKNEWSLCMKQLARVVKPGGRLVLTFDMSAQDANAYMYKRLIATCPLDLIGSIDYSVPIPDEDKRLRHPGHTYETNRSSVEEEMICKP